MEKWEQLEQYIAATFPAALKTKNSGRSHRDGDVLSPDFLIDGKIKGRTTGVSLPRDDITKTIQQALRKARKPMWVVQNMMGERYAVIPYEMLVLVMKELQGHRDTEPRL